MDWVWNNYTIFGGILLLAGVVGALFCAKLQKSNPNIQPVSMLMIVVIVVGMVLYVVGYMKGEDNTEISRLYSMADGNAYGKYVKSAASGKKVVWVVSEGVKDQEFGKARLEALKKASGSDAEYYEIKVGEGDPDHQITSKEVDEVAKSNPGAVLLIDLGWPAKGTPSCIGGKEKPVIIITGGMFDSKKVLDLVKKDKIQAVILNGNPDVKKDPDFKPTAKKLDETFNRSHVIVDKGNLDKYRDKF